MATIEEQHTPTLVDPWLLMAARHGNSRELNDLLQAAEQRGGDDASGVTIEGDSLLHVVAGCGDDDEFRACADAIISATSSRILIALNNKGDTALHCAARAGNAEMISYLVHRASNSNSTLVRMRNHCGETALHQAVRAGSKVSIDRLRSLDPQLLAYDNNNIPTNYSPLYLAISLGDMDIASHLFHTSNGNLSYTGPDGQNALHAAVIRDHAFPLIFKWFKDVTVHSRHGVRSLLCLLTEERDKHSGSTPLHLAASIEGLPRIRLFEVVDVKTESQLKTNLLLDANKSSAYQPDNEGLCPIHVAAKAGSLEVLKLLLKRCPDCGNLRDFKGRTFLHVAVEWSNYHIVAYACRLPELSSIIMNAQDNTGDTALHRAVRIGNLAVFYCLIRNQQVRLDIPNKEGLTPFDLSWREIPPRFNYGWNERNAIQLALVLFGAACGEGRPDLIYEKDINTKRDEEKDSNSHTDATQVMGIVSVLVTTVTFASAFTLPGGYRSADDSKSANNHGGTPVLAAGSYAFDAFILADALAFICSCVATFSLVFAGLPAMDLTIRNRYFNISGCLLRSSVRSLVAAFALGLYVVLAPVAHALAIAVCLITFAPLLYGNMEVYQVIRMGCIARARFGIRGVPLRAAASFARKICISILMSFWPFIVIFGFPATRKARTS